VVLPRRCAEPESGSPRATPRRRGAALHDLLRAGDARPRQPRGAEAAARDARKRRAATLPERRSRPTSLRASPTARPWGGCSRSRVCSRSCLHRSAWLMGVPGRARAEHDGRRVDRPTGRALMIVRSSYAAQIAKLDGERPPARRAGVSPAAPVPGRDHRREARPASRADDLDPSAGPTPVEITDSRRRRSCLLQHAELVAHASPSGNAATGRRVAEAVEAHAPRQQSESARHAKPSPMHMVEQRRTPEPSSRQVGARCSTAH